MKERSNYNNDFNKNDNVDFHKNDNIDFHKNDNFIQDSINNEKNYNYNNNNVTNNNIQSKQEKESVAAQKTGELAGRGAADAATGGNYEKIRNAPVVGNVAKKAEKKIGSNVAKVDKASGGNIGKIANKADDAGVLDAADKGMSIAGGSKPSGTSIQNKSNPSNPQNQPINSKPNFAKNGLNNENNIPNGNSEGANQSRLRNFFDKRKGVKDFFRPNLGSDKKSLFSNRNKKNDQNTGEQVTDVAAQMTKQLVKKSLLPFFVFFGLILLMFMILVTEDSDKEDATAGDSKKSIEERLGATDSKEQKEFYKRVIEVEDDYKKNGKEINPIYITSTYHALNRYGKVKYDDMTNSIIKDLSDGMLGNASVYNKDTYSSYLKGTFLPKYFDNKNKIERVNDEIFEYIDEYNKDMGYKDDESKKCSTTSSGACQYSFTGIVNGSGGRVDKQFSVSNLKVRLMSSTDKLCQGPNNDPISGDMVDFEEYVLGILYGELYNTMNPEVYKVHSIVARSFSLARGIEMGTYLKEGNQDILKMRPCVADHLYCNINTGCSATGKVQYGIDGVQYGHQLYQDTNHSVIHKQPISTIPENQSKNIRHGWEETIGMVALDEKGRVVETGYIVGWGNKDPNVWQKWAEEGKDYKSILLAAYPDIREIKSYNCATTTDNSENAFLKLAHELWQQVTDGNYVYTNGNMIPPDGRHIDCSAYVSWVLYKFGFEDFKGHQKVTQWFVTNDLHAKYGWEEIKVAPGEDVTSKLKPGDILVRDPGNNNGHMNIIAEIRSDGTVWGYDCGATNNWLSSRGGKVHNVSSFVKGDTWGGGRPGKIIRVTNGGTGGECETANAGEWSTWRQNGPAPWKDIPLGKSSRTIGSHGCYVTSIAIQVARSGAKTNLTNFNPGTFVTELNKYSNSFDSESGSFNNVGNVSKIVPGFTTFASNISVGNTKKDQIATIKKYIDDGKYVILNLDGGKHWVAVTGVTDDGIQMVDPGRNEKSVYDVYSVSSLVKITVFDIK